MIDKLLVSFGLKYLAAKMDGYKSYSGAAGKIIGGVVSILGDLVEDSMQLPPVFKESDLLINWGKLPKLRRYQNDSEKGS